METGGVDEYFCLGDGECEREVKPTPADILSCEVLEAFAACGRDPPVWALVDTAGVCEELLYLFGEVCVVAGWFLREYEGTLKFRQFARKELVGARWVLRGAPEVLGSPLEDVMDGSVESRARGVG